MSNSGWIKISRELTEMPDYFDEKFDRIRCWLDLLLLAEWKEERTFYKRGIAVTLKRGQLAVSVADLCRRWKLSHPTVEARLKEFEIAERITIKRSRLINVITIVNYAQYQDLPTESITETASNQVIAQEKARNTCKQKCEEICKEICELPKEIKEYNILHTLPRAREGDFFEEIKSENYYCEVVAAQFGLTSTSEVNEYIEKFKRHCVIGEIKHSSISDCKRHFRDWLKYQTINSKKKNETDTQTRTNSQRRGTDVTVTSAQSYEGEF